MRTKTNTKCFGFKDDCNLVKDCIPLKNPTGNPYSVTEGCAIVSSAVFDTMNESNSGGYVFLDMNYNRNNQDDSSIYCLSPMEALLLANTLTAYATKNISFTKELRKKNKMNYDLMSLLYKGTIDKITLYCSEINLDESLQLYGRYQFVVSGYKKDSNKSIINYEVLTNQSYCLHPDTIILDIKNALKMYELESVVEVDWDSVNDKISQLSGNPYDTTVDKDNIKEYISKIK